MSWKAGSNLDAIKCANCMNLKEHIWWDANVHWFFISIRVLFGVILFVNNFNFNYNQNSTKYRKSSLFGHIFIFLSSKQLCIILDRNKIDCLAKLLLLHGPVSVYIERCMIQAIGIHC